MDGLVVKGQEDNVSPPVLRLSIYSKAIIYILCIFVFVRVNLNIRRMFLGATERTAVLRDSDNNNNDSNNTLPKTGCFYCI